MANQRACQAVLDWILAHPDEHLQSHWVRTKQLSVKSEDVRGIPLEPPVDICNTTMCVGGTTVMLAGELNIDNDGNVTLLGRPIEEWHYGVETKVNAAGRELIVHSPSPVAAEHQVFDHEQYIEQRARELLGLDEDRAYHLFICTAKSNDHALRLLKALADGDMATFDADMESCEEGH